MKNIALAIGILALAGNAYAQKKSKKDNASSTNKEFKAALDNAGFSKTPNGLEYKLVKNAPGTNAKVGDYVDMVIVTKVGDSVLFESNKMNNNQPVQFQLATPQFKGDLVEGITMMSAGDSAVIQMSVDSLIKNGTPKQPWMIENSNQKLIYTVSLVNVKSQGEVEREKEMKSAQQKGIDDKLLQDYFAKNNIKAQKTSSGLYYKIDNPGAGENAKSGQKVTVNYTGKTLDGETFDSNVDPKFQHVQPFTFGLGQHQVIPGWDEGLMLMKKGSKGTLYIPSPLAYGAQGTGPIKPNSVLIFDIEVTDIQ